MRGGVIEPRCVGEWQAATTQDGRGDVAAIVSGTKLWGWAMLLDRGEKAGNGDVGCG